MLVGISFDQRRAELARSDLPLKEYVNLIIGTTLFTKNTVRFKCSIIDKMTNLCLWQSEKRPDKAQEADWTPEEPNLAFPMPLQWVLTTITEARQTRVHAIRVPGDDIQAYRES